jgi:hypothetical protein
LTTVVWSLGGRGIPVIGLGIRWVITRGRFIWYCEVWGGETGDGLGGKLGKLGSWGFCSCTLVNIFGMRSKHECFLLKCFVFVDRGLGAAAPNMYFTQCIERGHAPNEFFSAIDLVHCPGNAPRSQRIQSHHQTQEICVQSIICF